MSQFAREHDERINGVLRKRVYIQGESHLVDHETPLSKLLAGERYPEESAEDYEEDGIRRRECFGAGRAPFDWRGG